MGEIFEWGLCFERESAWTFLVGTQCLVFYLYVEAFPKFCLYQAGGSCIQYDSSNILSSLYASIVKKNRVFRFVYVVLRFSISFKL